jgi:hypothetical protein
MIKSDGNATKLKLCLTAHFYLDCDQCSYLIKWPGYIFLERVFLEVNDHRPLVMTMRFCHNCDVYSSMMDEFNQINTN